MKSTESLTKAAPLLLLNLDDVAAALGGLSRAHLYRLITSGQLHSVKCGRRRLVSVAALDAYVQQLTREAEGAS